MKLSIVIPAMNQFPLLKVAYKQLREVTDTLEQDVEFVIIDNGSKIALDESDVPGATIIRNEASTGVYPTFKQGFDNTTGDIVAFFHSDLIVWEQNWNLRVIQAFKDNVNLGMIGFIGSNEIDAAGGRGLGTTSQFMGRSISDGNQTWTGSAAHIHGKVNAGLTNAAVVDGCAMIINRDTWEDIGEKENFPPHHFYDRLISTQVLEKEWDINVLGVECDHISGQTVNQESDYHTMAEKWCNENGVAFDTGWDNTIYKEAERRWLKEYRDEKHLIPIKI